MKLTITTLSILVALSVACLGQSSPDTTVPFPQDGDLFIGFHGSAANEYLVDLGSYTQFDNQSVGFHLDIGNYAADLTTVFGSGWASDPNVQWGVAGTLDASSVVFASKVEPMVGMFAIPWARQSTSAQSVTGSTIDTMVYGDYAGQDSTPNNPRGVIHSTAGLSWASYNNGANSPGASFNTWVPTVEAPVFPGGSGIPTTRLDLFKMLPDNTGTNPPGTYMGSFDIDSAGNVSFDVFAPLPVVAASARIPNAYEREQRKGEFAITRDAASQTSLTVFYTVSGTATSGTDYRPLTGQAVIQAGKVYTRVIVRPIDDNISEPDETVIITLSPDAAYKVGTPDSGTVTIHSNE